MKTMIKLIACDLDGTLLDSRKQLPPGFFAQIKKMKRVRFVAASGRQYHNLLKIFAPVLNELTIIAENGALIWENGSIIHRESLAPADAYFMIQKAKNTDRAYPILCTEQCAYIEKGPEQMMEQVFRSYDRCCVIDDLSRMVPEGNICKLAVHSLDNRAEFDIYPVLRQEKGDFRVILSGTASVDVMKQGVSKGKALEMIQRRMGLEPGECLAFGDYLNDCELLQAVEESYAMENGHSELKRIAKHIAPSNDDFGVMQVIYAIERQNGFYADSVIAEKVHSGN